MIASKKDLLSLCMDEPIEEDFTGKNGMTVTVRALDGIPALRTSSIANLDDKLVYALPKMIVEPVMKVNEIIRLINKQADFMADVFQFGMELSNALGDAIAEESEAAKKN